MSKKILVADDEADVIDLVAMNLSASGYTVVTAADGPGALQKARAELPDLIVLDVMLPDLSGFSVCKTLKKDPLTEHIPIIMLTAKAMEVDRIKGLEIGADDYVTKPFSPRELVLRVSTVLRRSSGATNNEDTLILGPLRLNRLRRQVFANDEEILLTATEFKLLTVLVERPGRVLERDQLLDKVWGYDNAIYTRTVDTHVRRLREKLGSIGDCIETVRGFGYVMRITPQE